MKKLIIFFYIIVISFSNILAMDNPFLNKYDTEFEIPPFSKINNSHFMPAFLMGIDEHNREIASIINNPDKPSFENVIIALEKSGTLLDRTGAVFFNLSGSTSDEEIQNIEKEISPVLSEHYDSISLNPEIFQKIKYLWDNVDNLNLSSEERKILEEKYKNFKVITANNVCAHTPYLFDFFKGIKNILCKKGVFIFEVSYLQDVIDKLQFDTIYHEHMSYHSLLPLKKFVSNLGLEIIDFERVEAQGGSIRIYVSHTGSFKTKNLKIKKQIQKEINSGIFKKTTFDKFFSKIIKQKKIPLVTTFHGTYSGNSFFVKKFYNRSMTAGDRVITISKFIDDYVRFNFPNSKTRLKQISRGIDTSYFDLKSVTFFLYSSEVMIFFC